MSKPLNQSTFVPDKDKLWALVKENPSDFDAWVSLIKVVEKLSYNDIESISSVYDLFLLEFPLCYGYWKKYADHKLRLCTVDQASDVYERGVHSASYSVNLWVSYCSFAMLVYEDPADIQRVFERALSFVIRDYSCYLLWDKYIAFEYSQKHWRNLAYIYVRTLQYPTKKLHYYYESFKKLADIWNENMTHQENGSVDLQLDPLNGFVHEKIMNLIQDLISNCQPQSNLLKKYTYFGNYFYQKASEIDEKIHQFETKIRRQYFHTQPLDDNQLQNWHDYLDFVEMQGDFDWAVKLYERCLIPCANYPEFWFRYMVFVENNGGREIGCLTLDRATKVFLKQWAALHVFSGWYKEKIGDVMGSRATFVQCHSSLPSDFVEHVSREANMEKRLGNMESAFAVYQKALEVAKEKDDTRILSNLYSHFSRFTIKVTNNRDAARDILIKGIQHLPCCRSLLEELINFEMAHGGPGEINALNSIIGQAIASRSDDDSGLSYSDCEHISLLYLKFVDLCGTIDEVCKAWDRHIKLFPHAMRPKNLSNVASTEDNSMINGKIQSQDDDPHKSPLKKSHTAFQESESNIISMEEQAYSVKQEEVSQVRNLQDVEQCQLTHHHQTLTNDIPDSSGDATEMQPDEIQDSLRPSLEMLSLNSQDDEHQHKLKSCEAKLDNDNDTYRKHYPSSKQGDNLMDSIPTTRDQICHLQAETNPKTSDLRNSRQDGKSFYRHKSVNRSGQDPKKLPQSTCSGMHPQVPQTQEQIESQSTQYIPSGHPLTTNGLGCLHQPQSHNQNTASMQNPDQSQITAAYEYPPGYVGSGQNTQSQSLGSMLQLPQGSLLPAQYRSQNQNFLPNNQQYGQMQTNYEFDPQWWYYYQQLAVQQQTQEQQNINQLHVQAWNNYYQQQALETYYSSMQYGQRAVTSQGQVSENPYVQHTGQVTGHPHVQYQVPTEQLGHVAMQPQPHLQNSSNHLRDEVISHPHLQQKSPESELELTSAQHVQKQSPTDL